MSKWEYVDTTGQVTGVPNTPLSITVLKKDKMNWLCDIRDSVEMADLGLLIKIGTLYRKLAPPGSSLACIIITGTMSAQAEENATKFKIKVYKL